MIRRSLVVIACSIIHLNFQQGEKTLLFGWILRDFFRRVILSWDHHFGELKGCVDGVE